MARRRTIRSRSRSVASAGPFTATSVAASTLSVGSGVVVSFSSLAHLTASARFRARAPGPVSGRLCGTAARRGRPSCPVFPSPFGCRRWLLGHPMPRRGVGPGLRFTRHQRGFMRFTHPVFPGLWPPGVGRAARLWAQRLPKVRPRRRPSHRLRVPQRAPRKVASQSRNRASWRARHGHPGVKTARGRLPGGRRPINERYAVWLAWSWLAVSGRGRGRGPRRQPAPLPSSRPRACRSSAPSTRSRRRCAKPSGSP